VVPRIPKGRNINRKESSLSAYFFMLSSNWSQQRLLFVSWLSITLKSHRKTDPV
jgi:hypothetical protein